MTKKSFPAVEMLRRQALAKADVQGRWLSSAGDLTKAHQLAFDALCSMMKRFVGRQIASPTARLEGQMCLIAQFIIGVELVESAICQGQYSQAAALLKQELETAAAIDEIVKGRRRDGKTPNIGTAATKSFGRAYRTLNNIAHVSQSEIAKHLVFQKQGNVFGANLLPVFDKEMAFLLYGQHVSYILMIVSQADKSFHEMFDEGISNDEKMMVSTAFVMLLQAKVIEVPKEAVGAEHDWVRSFAKSKTEASD